MRDICPFVGISLKIVELLSPVRVANVTPLLRAGTVVVVVVRGEGGKLSRRIGIFELWHEAMPLQVIPFFQIAEFIQRWIDV